MTSASSEVVLRPATPFDRTQIRRWLQHPQVQRWWGNAASAEAEIRIALESATSLCRIIAVDASAIGYAQAVDAGDGNAGSSATAGAIPGAWTCTLFIGSEPHRGKGFGQQALDLLTREVFTTTLSVACMILVSIRNERAARAYEQIGYRWTSIVHDPLMGPCWRMVRERPRR